MRTIISRGLADWGTHGCPRVAKFELDHGGRAIQFIGVDEDACGTCDREGTTLWLPSVVEEVRSLYPGYVLKGWD